MKIKLTSFITLVLGFCFFAAYPNTDVSLTNETYFEVSENDLEDSSVKPVSYVHANDSFERIFTNNQNTFSPTCLKKLTDADTKASISKHETLIKRNRFLQYSRNLFLSFLTTDIIFPFHTFW
ncbi:hypothetical protein [Psychroserpens luteus]|jgi:hypothetical protein|uniref:Uncharacterized protein n=1 Tax=Psychroserpens luteus TaxID=1434066 RepID=A0ABW5ZSK8_9FLAO|nr:hypothetical protein [Psychroserpens luteus]